MLIVSSLSFAQDSSKDYEVMKSMSIPYEEGHLSDLSFTCEGKAYIKIFLGITTYDAQNFWNDIIVLTQKHKIFDIHIFINSPGGSVTAGLAIADQITKARNFGCKVTAHASGIVASAAVPIFAACDVRIAGEGTVFMVHEASLWKYLAEEKVKDLRAQVAMMELLEKNYIGKLVRHSKLTYDEWKAMEGQISYFTAEEAKRYGIVDIVEVEK